jgi:hypothetical protein
MLTGFCRMSTRVCTPLWMSVVKISSRVRPAYPSLKKSAVSGARESFQKALPSSCFFAGELGSFNRLACGTRSCYPDFSCQ